MNQIKVLAVANLANDDYQFSKMMSVLAWARADVENRAMGEMGHYAKEQRKAVSDYGVLASKHLIDAPVGMTISSEYSDTMEVAAGSEVVGFTINTGYSCSITYSISGPPDGLMFGSSNEYQANHRTAFVVLYGTVVWGLFKGYYIEESTATTVVYTILSDVRTPTYCQPLSGGVFYFSNPAAYHEMIEKYPETFL